MAVFSDTARSPLLVERWWAHLDDPHRFDSLLLLSGGAAAAAKSPPSRRWTADGYLRKPVWRPDPDWDMNEDHATYFKGYKYPQRHPCPSASIPGHAERRELIARMAAVMPSYGASRGDGEHAEVSREADGRRESGGSEGGAVDVVDIERVHEVDPLRGSEGRTAECGGRGLCDRTRGVCLCMPPHTGWSCTYNLTWSSRLRLPPVPPVEAASTSTADGIRPQEPPATPQEPTGEENEENRIRDRVDTQTTQDAAAEGRTAPRDAADEAAFLSAPSRREEFTQNACPDQTVSDTRVEKWDKRAVDRCAKMGDKNGMWLGLSQAQTRQLTMGVASALGLRDGVAVLDIGMGCGDMLQYIHDAMPRVRLAGIDYSKDGVSFVRRRFANVTGATRLSSSDDADDITTTARLGRGLPSTSDHVVPSRQNKRKLSHGTLPGGGGTHRGLLELPSDKKDEVETTAGRGVPSRHRGTKLRKTNHHPGPLSTRDDAADELSRKGGGGGGDEGGGQMKAGRGSGGGGGVFCVADVRHLHLLPTNSVDFAYENGVFSVTREGHCDTYLQAMRILRPNGTLLIHQTWHDRHKVKCWQNINMQSVERCLGNSGVGIRMEYILTRDLTEGAYDTYCAGETYAALYRKAWRGG